MEQKALHIACISANHNMAELLLLKDALVNSQDSDGDTQIC